MTWGLQIISSSFANYFLLSVQTTVPAKASANRIWVICFDIGSERV